MSNIIWLLIIFVVLVAFIILIVAAGKSKPEDKSEEYNPPVKIFLRSNRLRMFR